MKGNADPKAKPEGAEVGEDDLPITPAEARRLREENKALKAEQSRGRAERDQTDPPPAGKKKVQKPERVSSIFSEDWEDEDPDEDEGEEE